MDCDNEKIDYVVTYCDPNKLYWRILYKKYVIDAGLAKDVKKSRFLDNAGLFKYAIRGIGEYIPWIGTLHIVVQSLAEIPDWIDQKNVHIVRHQDMFPKDIQKQFLPSFNSNTIEKFLWNIPGLSEKFLYGNDDFLICKPLTKDMFFCKDENGDCKLNFNHKTMTVQKSSYTYSMTLLNSMKFLKKIGLRKDAIQKGIVEQQMNLHAPRPNFKSAMKELWDLHKDAIIKRLHRTRVREDLATLETGYYLHTGRAKYLNPLPNNFHKFVRDDDLIWLDSILKSYYTVGLKCNIPDNNVGEIDSILANFYRNKSRFEV